ncbi:helix-turn-helix domain-containing protein [Vibrio gazogenes]|nr:helix-turn-helix domain-containing protein [Vibrio gazogenes]
MSFSQTHHERNSLALKRCKSYSFDVNQQAESLVKWDQHYNQHSQGHFSGYLDELNFGGMHVFEEYTNQTLLQHCCVNEYNIWLGFSLQKQRPKINGTQIEEGQLMIRPSGVEFELITPKEFHIYGLVLDKRVLQQELTGLDADLWLNESSKILVSEPNTRVSYELAKIIGLMLRDHTPFSTVLNHHKGGERLKRLRPVISSAIADLLLQTETGMREIEVSAPAKRRVLERIRNHIEKTGRYPLTTTELCQIAYASRRTLQYCFEQELGVSPIQYLRDCRLNEIRRILLNTEEEIVISNLAVEFGFYHISTFNEHYKKLFGETPSQTRQRARLYHYKR